MHQLAGVLHGRFQVRLFVVEEINDALKARKDVEIGSLVCVFERELENHRPLIDQLVLFADAVHFEMSPVEGIEGT